MKLLRISPWRFGAVGAVASAIMVLLSEYPIADVKDRTQPVLLFPHRPKSRTKPAVVAQTPLEPPSVVRESVPPRPKPVVRPRPKPVPKRRLVKRRRRRPRVVQYPKPIPVPTPVPKSFPPVEVPEVSPPVLEVPPELDKDLAARLEREEAKTGDIRISLKWNNRNDLDLVVEPPVGSVIWFNNRRFVLGGELDVDMNREPPYSTAPVENIYWAVGTAANGTYRIWVSHHANNGDSDPTTFYIEMMEFGKIHQFSGSISSTDSIKLVEDVDVGGVHTEHQFGTFDPKNEKK
jgi:hypothetical protein